MKNTDKVLIETAMHERRFDEALLICQDILSRHGQEVDANYYAAVCLRYLKRHDQALIQLEKLRKVAPAHSRALQEMGHNFRDVGDFNNALHFYTRATHGNPSLQASWKHQIDILLKFKRKEEASRLIPYLERVVKMPRPLLGAMDYISQGRLADAEDICRDFLANTPHHVEAMRLLASIGIKLNVLHDAEFLLESALKLEPENAMLRVEHIEVLRKRQKIEKAHKSAASLLDEFPKNIHYASLFAVLCMQKGDYDSALKNFDNVLAKIPSDPVTQTSKGHALKTLGKTGAAIEAYRSATRNFLGFGEAWHSLANLKTFSFAEDDIKNMRDQLVSVDLKHTDRIYINFALGKALEDRKDFGEAFKHYAAGNKAKKLQSRYKPEQITAEFNRQKAIFKGELLSKCKFSGFESSDPIFVLGLPRAGSTLLEQILSSHSLIDGTLELPNILSLVNSFRRDGRLTGEDRYPRVLGELTADDFRSFGESYINDTKIHREDAPFFVDKMPNNFRHIGLIKLILPNAKIIDARRHPMACCFSGFKQLFAEGQEFSNDLEYAGLYYRDYIGLMDFWQKVFPEEILLVEYEDVVADLDGSVRKILDYCDLPFEKGCLDFHLTDRAVRTPSSEQVRQPIYKEGLEQWRHFEEHLGPLKAALGPILDRYPID